MFKDLFKKRKNEKTVYEVRLTLKGVAVYLAIKNGFCPKKKGVYDTKKFERFWDEFEKHLPKETSNEHKEI